MPSIETAPAAASRLPVTSVRACASRLGITERDVTRLLILGRLTAHAEPGRPIKVVISSVDKFAAELGLAATAATPAK